MERYSFDDIVWIKIPKYPWWPAKVITKDDCPTIYTGNKPAIYVKFLNEEYFERITDEKKIQCFDFDRKNELIQKGSEIADKLNLRLEFDGAVSIALEKCRTSSSSNHDTVLQKRHTEKIEKQDLSDSSGTGQIKQGSKVQTGTAGKLNKILFRNEIFESGQLDNYSVQSKDHVVDGNSRSEDNGLVKCENLKKLIPSKRKSKLICDDTSKRKRLKATSNSKNGVKLTKGKRFIPEENTCTNSENHSYLDKSCNKRTSFETEHKKENESYLDDSGYLPTPDSERTTSVFRRILNSNSLSFDPNLSKDLCDDSDDSDSDVDFPEGLSPIVGEYPIAEKDIIWVGWKKYPFWPAYVRRIYRKKRHISKISIMFLGSREEIPKILTLRYRPKKMLHFVHRDKDEFIRIGRCQEDGMKKNFLEALELAEDYLNKKALGHLKTGEMAFLFENFDETNIENYSDETWEQSDTMYDDDSCKNSTDFDNYATQLDSKQHLLEMKDGISKKEQQRQLKSKMKQKDLVSFIMSEKMKAFLFDIRTGKRKSERHEKFFSRRTKVRQSLRFAGFGPIANEEQQEEIIATFINWLIECDSTKETLPDAGYVMDVWIPEALVHALTQVKTYSRSVAWKRIDNGSGLF